MKQTHHALLRLAALALLCVTCSCTTPPQPPTAVETPPDPDALAFDPAVTRGQLDNGIRYLIRPNGKPEDRVELRLVVDAGSVLETDAQQGLAHFVEHMAFNGTTHFAKNELVDYLEALGLGFGPDLNAYTSFDETVYMLQVPTDDAKVMDTAFVILADWAVGISNDAEEIDKERGVIIEEWRSRRGAHQRVRDKQFPILFKDSRYAERLPIGKKEILESFEHETLRAFYTTWYRPELMTVIAVGDEDPKELQGLIQKHFGALPASPTPVDRPTFEVPDQPDRRISVVGDPELTQSSVNVYYLRPPDELKTRSDYRRSLRDSLFSGMLNNRFEEIRKQPDPPFLRAHAHKGGYLRTKGVFMLGATVKEGGMPRGLTAVLAEAERLQRFGFTEGELDRARKRSLRAAQVQFNERNNTESGAYARAYVRSVTRDRVSPGAERELRLHEEMLDTITLDELNGLIAEWITETNCVVLASGPEEKGAPLPSEDTLATVFPAVTSMSLDPYVDDVGTGSLAPEDIGPAGSVVEKTLDEDLGVHTWRLSNGIRLVLKPTDFKEDEILLSAYSPGGHSLAEDDIFIPASTAATVAQEGGVAGFSAIQLQKKLAGKVVHLGPFVEALREGWKGRCSPEDLETLFQLLYLRFTSPREDAKTFASYQERTRASLKNRLANPSAVFGDRVKEVMSQGHLRRKPWTPETVDRMDLAKSMEVYRERFADADDFVFFLVGNLDLGAVERLACRYLAVLPAIEGEEQWIDRKVRRPTGEVREEVRKGLEKKARVHKMYWGDFEWKIEERFAIRSMMMALSIRLREVLREDQGGTYGVGAYPAYEQYPIPTYTLQIMFGCDPERMEDLIPLVDEQIKALCETPLEELYVTKVKEGQRRRREVQLKENGFWLSVLQFYHWNGEDPKTSILDFDKHIDAISAEQIRATAQKYFGTENRALFTLLPEGE